MVLKQQNANYKIDNWKSYNLDKLSSVWYWKIPGSISKTAEKGIWSFLLHLKVCEMKALPQATKQAGIIVIESLLLVSPFFSLDNISSSKGADQ